MDRPAWWLDKGGCGHCHYCGMDMDMDPYCVHPTVVKDNPYGLNISKALKLYCDHKLWQERDKK